MAKSKVRGGAKAHRKKVEARNQRISGERNMMQKLFEESMRKQIEELKEFIKSNKPVTTQTTQTPEQNTPVVDDFVVAKRIDPERCNCCAGADVPIPTLPSL